MCGIDNNQIAFSINQRLGIRQALFAYGSRRCNAQPTGTVLCGIRIENGFLDILNGDQANTMIGIIDDQQLLDPSLVQQTPRFFLRDRRRYRRQIFVRHQFGHRLRRVFCKTNVTVGQYAGKLAARLNHRNTGNRVRQHQCLCFGQSGVRRNGYGVHDHTAFKALYLTDRSALFFDGQVTVQNANAAKLRHDNSHACFSHGIHRRRQNRNVKRNALG